jgi:hypothetical protein
VREEFERYLRCGIQAHASRACTAAPADRICWSRSPARIEVSARPAARGACRTLRSTSPSGCSRTCRSGSGSCRRRAGHAGPWLGTRAESVAPSMRRSRLSSRSSGAAPVGRASGAATVALFRSFRDLATR